MRHYLALSKNNHALIFHNGDGAPQVSHKTNIRKCNIRILRICNTATLIEIYHNRLGPAYKVCKETGEWWAYPNSTQSWSNYTLCSAVNIEVNTSSKSNT